MIPYSHDGRQGGAGRGIGRGIALAMARPGAAVVVNDTGGTLGGSGRDARPAFETVAALRPLETTLDVFDG